MECEMMVSILSLALGLYIGFIIGFSFSFFPKGKEIQLMILTAINQYLPSKEPKTINKP